MTNNLKSKNNQIQDDEINVSFLINILFRNKKLISFFTGIATIFAIVYSYIAKPVYQGNFEIIVDSQNNGGFNNSTDGFQDMFLKGSIPLSNSELETQKFILQSPFVLQSVFNYAKENDPEIKSVKDINFNSWRDKYFSIEYKEKSNVLSIGFRNSDKDLILDVLDITLKKYKSYSKSDREKDLKRTIDFLSEQQKIYKNKSDISRRELNVFTIENGLGDIDGFIDLEKSNISNIDNGFGNANKLDLKFLNKNFQLENRKSRFGQRYKNQFALLEGYEAEYTNLSSRLKPNSKYLKNLELKIENLKTSLKRPNEILVKFRNLKDQAERDESVLNSISDELVIVQLEKVKQLEPWRMISKPTIDARRVFPKRKSLVGFTFLISFFISYIFSWLIEKKSGKLFELDELKSFLESDYLDVIYLNKFDINKRLVESITKSKKGNIGVIQVDLVNQIGVNIFEQLFNKNENFSSVNILDDEQMNKFDNHILVVQQGLCSKSQIEFVNKLVKIYKDRIVGWFYIAENI